VSAVSSVGGDIAALDPLLRLRSWYAENPHLRIPARKRRYSSSNGSQRDGPEVVPPSLREEGTGGLPTVYVSVTDEILAIRSRSSHALHVSLIVGSPHRAHALSAAGGYFPWRSGRIWSNPRKIAWLVPGLSSSRRWTMSRKRPRWARSAYGHVASWNSMLRRRAYS